jgi:hypothetical protein
MKTYEVYLNIIEKVAGKKLHQSEVKKIVGGWRIGQIFSGTRLRKVNPNRNTGKLK